MQQGALNTNRITIRGIGARSQYGTDRVKAYLNGIPISHAAGTTVIEDIDPNILEKVEVIKAPASSIYGAGLGGAINLYTLSPAKNSIHAETGFGSFGYSKASLSAALKGEKSGVLISFNEVNSDGFRANNNYRRQSLTANAKFQIAQTTELSAFSNMVRLKAEIPSSLNAMDFKNSPRSANANWAAANGYESYDKWIFGLALRHSFREGFTNLTSVFGQYRDAYEPRPFNILDEDQLGFGARTVFGLNYDLLDLPSEMAFGAEFLIEDYSVAIFENRYRDFNDQGSVQGAKLNSNDQQRSYVNLFFDQKTALGDRLELTLGINLNSTQYSLDDTFAYDSLNQSGSYHFDLIASPRLGATYQLASSHSLYATLSQGFSTPGVDESITPAGAVNTGLLPETGWNAELGFRSGLLGESLQLELAVYTIFVDNLLVARRVAEDQYVGINAGKTQHTGLEISINYSRLIGRHVLVKPYFAAAVNEFTFTDFTDRDQNYDGNALTGVPGHTINVGIDGRIGSSLSFNFNWLNVGRIPLNDENTVYSDAYSLLNLHMAYGLSVFRKVKLEILAGIGNIANVNYASSILPNATGFGNSEPRYFYPGDGRSFYAGISLTL